MRFRLVLFVLFSTCSLAISQKQVQDSLYTRLQKLPEDTSKIEPYFEFGYTFEASSIDSAIYYFNKAKLICDQYNHVKGKIKYAGIYSGILNEQGKLQESYAVSMDAFSLALQHHLYFELAKTCNNLGNVLNYMGEFDSSMTYFLRSATIFEKINRKEYLHVIYQNIGGVYLSLGNFEKSIEYAKKAIELSKLKKDSVSISNALNNLGGALVCLQKYEEALDAFNNCLDISAKIGNSYAENQAYVGLGNLYTQTKDYDQAIKVLMKALVTARKMHYTNNLANGLNALATVYYEKGNFSLANTYATEAVTINEKYNVYHNLHQQYKIISDIRAKIGQYPSAYDYLLKYVTLNDSLSNVESKKNVNELEKKYQTAEKDKQIYENNLKLTENKLQIEQHEKRIQKTNNWLILTSAAIVILILVLILVYFINSQKNKLQKQKMVALEKEQEVMKLKATLDGQLQERQRIAREMHDEIGSGLTTILFLSNQLGNDNPKTLKVAETSRQLISQMNEIIWSMNIEQDKLQDMVAYIRHNAGEMLSAVNIDYDFHIPDEIPNHTISGMQRRNIYLVVKESLHNIIKHSAAGLVTIKMDFTDGIFISVSDNGKGIANDVKNPFGNGIKNMEYRMKEIGGEWKISSSNPFTIEIRLNKKNLV